MASLLSKFRIDYSDLKVIPNITKKPQESTKQFFDSLITDFTKDKEGEEDSGGLIELLLMKLSNISRTLILIKMPTFSSYF